MPTLRTRFKKEIVAEFLPPSRPTKKQRVIILCDGMPSLPSKSRLLEFLAKKGFWVFYPRYRGAWESAGTFLQYSPEQDVLDVINEIPRGFMSLWDKKKYKVQPDEIFIIAGSFGGPAGILASRDKRVKKVVLISPVVDWQAPSEAEPMDWLENFVHDAFGNGYRFSHQEWKKLSDGKFYSPAYHHKEIDGRKLFIFHAKDDASVRSHEVIKFAHDVDASLKLFNKGGHLKTVEVVGKYWNQIKTFLGK